VKTLEPLPILPTGAGGGAYLASFYREEQRHALILPQLAILPPDKRPLARSRADR
jgi:hypothetical protein